MLIQSRRSLAVSESCSEDLLFGFSGLSTFFLVGLGLHAFLIVLLTVVTFSHDFFSMYIELGTEAK